MSFIGKFIDRVTGRESAKLHRIVKRYSSAIQAAQRGGAGPGWSGINSNRDEDAANKEYLTALADVLQRSQDLDVNNPDLRGFHRARTAQIVGAHVRFKSAPRPSEIGVSADDLVKITGEIDRVRDLHSRTGGFDSTNHNRSEGEQQERAIITANAN